MRKTYFRKQNSIKGKISIFKNRFFLFGILLAIISIGAFYLIFFHSFFQIEEIIISGQNKVSKEKIEQGVEKEIEKKILFFSSKSIFLADNEKIRENILVSFPEIAEAKISKGFPDALHILIEERKEIAYWRQGEKSFLLDSEGIIFEEITEEISGNILEIKTVAAGEAIPELGQRVIEKEMISRILEFKTKLKQNLKILAKEIQIVSDQRLNIKTSEGWEIYVNPDKSLDWQITKLGLVLEKKIPPEKREELEYIELRFEELAPFRFRD